jgi:hypothetical protein
MIGVYFENVVFDWHSAFPFERSIRILLLLNNAYIKHMRTLILHIVKGKIHQAAITALVAVLIRTIDQLLLTELL